MLIPLESVIQIQSVLLVAVYDASLELAFCIERCWTLLIGIDWVKSKLASTTAYTIAFGLTLHFHSQVDAMYKITF